MTSSLLLRFGDLAGEKAGDHFSMVGSLPHA